MSVTCLEVLGVPTFCPPNASDDTEAVTAFVPVPDSVTTFGDAVVLLVITREPLRAPPIVGFITSERVQLALAASVVPQVVLFCSKSPETVTEVKVTATFW